MGQLKYLLDTNILSEVAKIEPNPLVMQRFKEHDGQYGTVAIVWHEMVYGCELLIESKRKQRLKSFLTMLSKTGLIILPYDENAATCHAKERARLQLQGLTCSYADGEIASIAISHHLTLVTRNTDDFKNFKSLTLENWFKSNVQEG